MWWKHLTKSMMDPKRSADSSHKQKRSTVARYHCFCRGRFECMAIYFTRPVMVFLDVAHRSIMSGAFRIASVQFDNSTNKCLRATIFREGTWLLGNLFQVQSSYAWITEIIQNGLASGFSQNANFSKTLLLDFYSPVQAAPDLSFR